MGPFLSGFTDELVKLSAEPAHHRGRDALTASSGLYPKKPRTAGQVAMTQNAERPYAGVTPMGTPNALAFYTSGSR